MDLGVSQMYPGGTVQCPSDFWQQPADPLMKSLPTGICGALHANRPMPARSPSPHFQIPDPGLLRNPNPTVQEVVLHLPDDD